MFDLKYNVYMFAIQMPNQYRKDINFTVKLMNL